MPSRASRWPGNDTPLSGHHGDTAKAALRAIKESQREAAQRRFDMGREAAQRMIAKAVIASDAAPKRDRKRPSAAAPVAVKIAARSQWNCRAASRYVPGRTGGRTARNPATVQVQKIVLRIAQRGICPLCGLPMSQESNIDHVVPRSGGGPDMWGNLMLTHRDCNSRKGNDIPTGCELIWLYFVNARLGSEMTRGFMVGFKDTPDARLLTTILPDCRRLL